MDRGGKERFIKINEREIKVGVDVVTLHLSSLVDADKVPIVKDGKPVLCVRAKSGLGNFSERGPSAEKLFEKAAAFYSTKGNIPWEDWLCVTVRRGDGWCDIDKGTAVSIGYDPIQRANVGRKNELVRRKASYGDGWGTAEEEVLADGLVRERDYHRSRTRHDKAGMPIQYTKADPDKLQFHVRDTPEVRAALDSLIAKLSALHDRVVEICGKKGEGVEQFLSLIVSMPVVLSLPPGKTR